MHGKATEPKVFVGTDGIADVSIGGVTLFISKAIDGHREKLHTILEILIHMRCGGPLHVELPLAKGFRSSLMSGKGAEPISNKLEALFDRLSKVTALVQLLAA